MECDMQGLLRRADEARDAILPLQLQVQGKPEFANKN